MLQRENIAKEIVEKVEEVHYKVDAIAHHVIDKVPTAHKSDRVVSVKGLLLDTSNKFDTINYIYILSKKNRLKGVVSIKELLSADPEKKMSEIMRKDNLITALPHTDQEKVAHMALKNNLKAIPVVDKKNKFLGIVPSDQILKILDQESEEDLLKFSGYILGSDHPEEESKQPVRVSYLHRIPWIIVGLLGGTVTAQLISYYGGLLSQNLILASFIPLVAYLASAVGSQTQTVLIRDMSHSSINFANYLIKQLLVAILIGLSCWVLIFFLTLFIWEQYYTSFVIGLAVFFAVASSAVFAILIPYILKKIKMDPAIGSGPFTTVIQDFVSIMIYFTVAAALL